jgi:hypothetical protein
MRPRPPWRCVIAPCRHNIACSPRSIRKQFARIENGIFSRKSGHFAVFADEIKSPVVETDNHCAQVLAPDSD